MSLVFPTPVGVFLVCPAASRLSRCLPHARGGVSLYFVPPLFLSESSPRPWGCFLKKTAPVSHFFVFPTPVGVFLIGIPSMIQARSLPHARGGVSYR